jgi:regulator of RNase E activity RraA
MAEVVLGKDYRCAPEGHTTYVYLRGQRVSGVVAEMAIRDGYAIKPRSPRTTKPARPKLTK